jgi:hypothetical protein
MWGVSVTHCGLLLDLSNISSINPPEQQELALEGCTCHIYLSCENPQITYKISKFSNLVTDLCKCLRFSKADSCISHSCHQESDISIYI